MPEAQTSAAPRTAAPVPEQTVRWDIDPAHSTVLFSVRHMMVSNVRGRFSGVSGTVDLAPDISQSAIKATVDVATIETHDEKRDGHLKSPDFLDVAQFPQMTFASKRIEKKGEGALKLTGDLTLHGVTKEISFDVSVSEGELKDPFGFMRRGASGHTKINRKEFGLNFNVPLEGGGVLVGEMVTIEIDVELSRKA